MDKHTPGPWHKRIERGQQEIVSGNTYIGRVYGCEDEDTVANGDLIASAPDLLAENRALRGFVARVAAQPCGYVDMGYPDPCDPEAETLCHTCAARALLRGEKEE